MAYSPVLGDNLIPSVVCHFSSISRRLATHTFVRRRQEILKSHYLYVGAVPDSGGNGVVRDYRLADRLLLIHRVDLLRRFHARADRHAIHQAARTQTV